jgi:AcrR family transcriptional regulator
MSRTGRRPGTPETREAILVIARRRFAVRGYDATSLRDIATEAEVDPALIIHYFRTKEKLFAAATDLPDGLSDVLQSLTALPLHDFAQALVRAYLDLIDSDDSRNAILALVRSAVSNENAAATLREFLTVQLLPAIERLTRHPDAPLRASLVAAQLIGITTQRHVIRLEPLVRATPGEIVALVAPAIEQYLRLAARRPLPSATEHCPGCAAQGLTGPDVRRRMS